MICLFCPCLVNSQLQKALILLAANKIDIKNSVTRPPPLLPLSVKVKSTKRLLKLRLSSCVR